MESGSFVFHAYRRNLERCFGIILDLYGGFLCLNNEFPLIADPERIIEKLSFAPDAEWFSQHDFPVSFRMSLIIVHVPSKRMEKRIDKVLPKLGSLYFSCPRRYASR